MLGQFYFCFSLLTVCRIYILYFTVAVEVEETSFESVSLIALHEASASRRKMILLSSPSEPERPTAATADDHFVMFHTQKMNELVGSAALQHFSIACDRHKHEGLRCAASLDMQAL